MLCLKCRCSKEVHFFEAELAKSQRLNIFFDVRLSCFLLCMPFLNGVVQAKACKAVMLISGHVPLQAMGLASVRSFSRLLPLLLDWVHAPDVDTRLAALPVLHAVLKHTWPRLPAHASIIWQHVAQEFARDIEFVQKAGDLHPVFS